MLIHKRVIVIALVIESLLDEYPNVVRVIEWTLKTPRDILQSMNYTPGTVATET